MTTDQRTEQRLTPEELVQHDGKDGRPAYVAYKGKVFDVTASKLWRKGLHVRAHKAGSDLTTAMLAAPHEDDVMSRMPQIGILITEDEANGLVLAQTPWWVQLSLDHHLHPIAVHFPTALGAVAPLFALLSLFFIGSETYYTLQAVAFWNLVICALATVPAVITGVISWYYSYSAVWTPIYRIKWTFSGILLVLTYAAISVRIFAMNSPEPTGVTFWLYSVLVISHAPVVIVLGHYGGKITFPS